MSVASLVEQALGTWDRAVAIWVAGGWCMPPIAITALVMFGLAIHIHLKLRDKGFQAVPEARWRRWLHEPEERRGPIGGLLDAVTGVPSIEALAVTFHEVRTVELAPFRRDLRLMKVCVGAAPLLGLLGTVTGMLATFAALASEAGAEKTMSLIASGISEALITTETGLVVALPGVFLQHHLSRKHERYRAFLAHLETVCTQSLYRRLHPARGRRRARAESR